MKNRSLFRSALSRGLIFAGVACLFVGCARQVYVPVERVVSDTIHRIECRVDTIACRDSIFVGSRGDTVVKEVYRWRQRVHTRVDTIYRVRVDTLDTKAASASIAAAEEKQEQERKYARIITLVTRLAILTALIIILISYLRRRKA